MSTVAVFKRITNFIFIYRIPVYVLIFLLVVSPLRYRYAIAHPEVFIVALCFSSLMAFVYLFNKVTDHVEDVINKSSGPISLRAARPTLIVALFCLFVPFAYLVFEPRYIPLYCGVALAGFLYSYRITFNKKAYRLKDVLLVKTMVTAVTWSLIPTVVHSLVLLKPLVSIGTATNFLALFCIFFSFGILSDVRDMEGDKAAGVRTIANTFGVRTVQVVSTVLLIIYTLLVLPHHLTSLFIIGDVFAFVFIWTVNAKRGAWFYYLFISAAIGFFFVLGFLP